MLIIGLLDEVLYVSTQCIQASIPTVVPYFGQYLKPLNRLKLIPPPYQGLNWGSAFFIQELISS
jgi:hypothetical protein